MSSVAAEGDREVYTIDVELTNHCNTHCDFCPRERTPHEGRMTDATLEQALARAVEFRSDALRISGTEVRVSFCGLGETPLHRGLAGSIRKARSVGFAPSVCSNGSTLTEGVSRELIEAGMARIYVNCGEIGDAYERVYHIGFQRLVSNVRRFLELAGAACELHIVLVDHRSDPARIEQVRTFWLEQGVKYFFASPMLNRAGTLRVEGMDFEGSIHQQGATARLAARGPLPICAAAFAFPFIGYDGTYYLCSSDWEKRVACGNVFEHSVLDTLGRRLEATSTRSPICRHCNHDPINKLATALREQERGVVDASHVDLVEAIVVQGSDKARRWVATVAASRAGLTDRRDESQT